MYNNSWQVYDLFVDVIKITVGHCGCNRFMLLWFYELLMALVVHWFDRALTVCQS